ncbi:MAG TPA: hypothetical protein VHU83_06355 [Bryobacteraceae bacterium]|jgi:hypothetical protein|nr:hypothetical protein [Bryobacteraceae bacterium]
MNIRNRLQALERRSPTGEVVLHMANGRRWPIAADSILEVHQTLLKRAREWHEHGGNFPLPDDVVESIPLLPKLLESVGVELDLSAKFPDIPLGPAIASIKLLVQRPPREVSEDGRGKFMMLPSVTGPIRISFVRPNQERD